MELTQAYLKECFDYDPATGNLIWRVRPRNHFKNSQAYERSKRFAGRVAGSRGNNGYWYLFLGKRRTAHRLVWFWHHGRFPAEEIDHINHNRSDNRIENLRECTRSENARWSRFRNSYGLRGIYSSPPNRWGAKLRVGGKNLYLGSFKSEKDAALAYARAAVDHFGKFAPIEAKELFEASYP